MYFATYGECEKVTVDGGLYVWRFRWYFCIDQCVSGVQK